MVLLKFIVIPHVNKQEEVSAIYAQLKEKHGAAYKPEQLNTWADMLHLKTHDSLDTPPNKLYSARKRAISPEKTTVSKKLSSSVSPHR